MLAAHRCAKLWREAPPIGPSGCAELPVLTIARMLAIVRDATDATVRRTITESPHLPSARTLRLVSQARGCPPFVHRARPRSH